VIAIADLKITEMVVRAKFAIYRLKCRLGSGWVPRLLLDGVQLIPVGYAFGVIKGALNDACDDGPSSCKCIVVRVMRFQNVLSAAFPAGRLLASTLRV
jgi:hypothetical protein